VPGPPTVVTGVADGLSTSGATLHGTVTPNGYVVSDCRFQYGIGNLKQWSYCQGTPTDSSFTPEPVTFALKNAQADKTYQCRLVATNARGPSVGDTKTFQTCDADHLHFGHAELYRCFIKPDHGAWGVSDALTVNGIRIEPVDAGSLSVSELGSAPPDDPADPGIT
jgi:hypothetical protein